MTKKAIARKKRLIKATRRTPGNMQRQAKIHNTTALRNTPLPSPQQAKGNLTAAKRFRASMKGKPGGFATRGDRLRKSFVQGTTDTTRKTPTRARSARVKFERTRGATGGRRVFKRDTRGRFA